jgi:hypothetical protein
MRKAAIVLVLLMTVPILASADLTVKEKTTVRAFMGIWSGHGEETTYVKGDNFRNESQVERSGFTNPVPIENPPPRVTIVKLGDGIMYRVNLHDKTYQELSLEEKAAADKMQQQFTIADLQVTPTGETKEIAGRTCRGVSVKVTFQVGQGDETVPEKLNMLFWVTDDTKGLEEMRTFWEQSLRLAQGQDQKVPMWDVLDKMWQENDELKGIPLGMSVTIQATMEPERQAELEEQARALLEAKAAQGAEVPTEEAQPNIKMEREVVSISSGKIDDSLFQVPEGFRKAARIRIW